MASARSRAGVGGARGADVRVVCPVAYGAASSGAINGLGCTRVGHGHSDGPSEAVPARPPRPRRSRRSPPSPPPRRSRQPGDHSRVPDVRRRIPRAARAPCRPAGRGSPPGRVGQTPGRAAGTHGRRIDAVPGRSPPGGSCLPPHDVADMTPRGPAARRGAQSTTPGSETDRRLPPMAGHRNVHRPHEPLFGPLTRSAPSRGHRHSVDHLRDQAQLPDRRPTITPRHVDRRRYRAIVGRRYRRTTPVRARTAGLVHADEPLLAAGTAASAEPSSRTADLTLHRACRGQHQL
jgi:hypothetical protein